MGTNMFDPARDGHALDKLRHSDPKIDRKLRGVGGRAKQFAKLQGEGIMVTTALSPEHAARKAKGLTTLSMETTAEARDRFNRLRGPPRTRDPTN